MLLGMAWFGYWADPWMKLIGRSTEELRSSASTMPYVFSFVEAIVFALLAGWLVRKMNAHTLVSGARVCFIVACATIGIAAVTNYQFAMRPMKLAFIDFTFPILSLTVMGAIQGVWKTKALRFAKLTSL